MTASGPLRVRGVAFSFQRIRRDVAPTPSRGVLPVLGTARLPRAHALGWPRTAFLVPVPAGEALWIGLGESTAGPAAIRARLDGLDGITGLAWDATLSTDPQNYVVWPLQRWIEGAYRDGRLRQRFALDAEPWRLLEFVIVAPGRGGSRPAPARPRARVPVQQEIGGAGGAMAEPGALVPDRSGIRWATAPRATIRVYLTSPAVYADVTGRPPLPEVADEDTYRGWRLP